MASVSCKPIYPVTISISITLNALLTEGILLDTSSSPNLINKYLLPTAWKESDKPIKSPKFRAANCKDVNRVDFVPLLILICDLCVRNWSRIVENFAFDVLLRTAFID